MPRKFLDMPGLTYVFTKIKSLLSDDAFAERAKAGVVTTAGDGAAYTATVPGVTELYTGLEIKIIPHVVSSSTTPTLDVNGLGAKTIRQRTSVNAAATAAGALATWISAGKPITMMYDGTYWIVDFTRPSAGYLMGTVPVTGGGTGADTAKEARTNLEITPENIGAAPAYTYGTEDLVAGSSELETGKLYFVYE